MAYWGHLGPISGVVTFITLPINSLQLTAKAPENRLYIPKGNNRNPTIHLQVQLLLVSGRVLTYLLDILLMVQKSCTTWQCKKPGKKKGFQLPISTGE